jgi:hypothetical protein
MHGHVSRMDVPDPLYAGGGLLRAKIIRQQTSQCMRAANSKAKEIATASDKTFADGSFFAMGILAKHVLVTSSYLLSAMTYVCYATYLVLFRESLSSVSAACSKGLLMNGACCRTSMNWEMRVCRSCGH